MEAIEKILLCETYHPRDSKAEYSQVKCKVNVDAGLSPLSSPVQSVFWSLGETRSPTPSLKLTGADCPSSTKFEESTTDSLSPLLLGSITASAFLESITPVGVPGKAFICLNE